MKFPFCEQMLKEGRQAINDDRLELIQNVTTDIIQAHMDTCNYTAQKVRDGMARYKQQPCILVSFIHHLTQPHFHTVKCSTKRRL